MTANQTLSEIETVSMREYFDYEDETFTPWLRDNINQLGSEGPLRINLTDVETEATVDQSGIQADLKATGADGELTAVIENQFEESDPDHFGRSLVYASGVDADIVVWIAEEFLERHVRAMRWLNVTSEDDTAFFAIEVNLRRIDDSPYAVEFRTRVQPENWEEQVQREHLSPAKQRRFEFWQEFKQAYRKHGLEGSKPKGESASHSVYVFESGKKPAYVRPTIELGPVAKNMIRFYEGAKQVAWNEEGQKRFETVFEEVIADSDTALTTELVDSLRWDTQRGRDLDKAVIKHPDPAHDGFKHDETVENLRNWMVETTLVLQQTLIRLAQDGEIEATQR